MCESASASDTLSFLRNSTEQCSCERMTCWRAVAASRIYAPVPSSDRADAVEVVFSRLWFNFAISARARRYGGEELTTLPVCQ